MRAGLDPAGLLQLTVSSTRGSGPRSVAGVCPSHCVHDLFIPSSVASSPSPLQKCCNHPEVFQFHFITFIPSNYLRPEFSATLRDVGSEAQFIFRKE